MLLKGTRDLSLMISRLKMVDPLGKLCFPGFSMSLFTELRLKFEDFLWEATNVWFPEFIRSASDTWDAAFDKFSPLFYAEQVHTEAWLYVDGTLSQYESSDLPQWRVGPDDYDSIPPILFQLCAECTSFTNPCKHLVCQACKDSGHVDMSHACPHADILDVEKMSREEWDKYFASGPVLERSWYTKVKSSFLYGTEALHRYRSRVKQWRLRKIKEGSPIGWFLWLPSELTRIVVQPYAKAYGYAVSSLLRGDIKTFYDKDIEQVFGIHVAGFYTSLIPSVSLAFAGHAVGGLYWYLLTQSLLHLGDKFHERQQTISLLTRAAERQGIKVKFD